ncbi:hypothetical protein [Anaerosporobacter sp.]
MKKKSMKKRVICTVVIVSLIFTMVGCSKSSKDNTNMSTVESEDSSADISTDSSTGSSNGSYKTNDTYVDSSESAWGK